MDAVARRPDSAQVQGARARNPSEPREKGRAGAGVDVVSYLPILQSAPQFAGLDTEEIAHILRTGYHQTAFRGDYLTRIGEPADCCYVLLQGAVEIRVGYGAGRVPVAVLEDGQMIGEMGLFQPQCKRLADAVVQCDSHLVQLLYGKLRYLLGHEKNLALRFLANLRTISVGRSKSGLLGGSGNASEARPHDPHPASQGAVVDLVADQPPSPAPEGAIGPLLVPIQVKMALVRCPVFQDFTETEISDLASLGEPVRMVQNSLLIKAGDPADCLYVLALGRLAVVVKEGNVVEPVAEIRPGQCVGEYPLASDLPTRTASVAALTSASLVKIGYQALRDWAASHPQTNGKLSANLARIAAEINSRR